MSKGTGRFLYVLGMLLLLAVVLFSLPRLYNALYAINWVYDPPPPVEPVKVAPLIAEPEPEIQKFKFFKKAGDIPVDEILKTPPPVQKKPAE